MNKKTIFIVGGVIAALGIGYYLWTKRKKGDSKTENKETQKNISSEKAIIDENWKKIAEASANKIKIGNVGDALSKTAQKLTPIKSMSVRTMRDE